MSYRAFLGAIVAASLPVTSVLAQDFPQRQPVKLVVTFAPGGGADSAARAISDKLGEKLGHPVIRRLHEAATTALGEADVRGRLEAQGLTVVAGSPEELDRLVSREIRLFGQVVKDQGIKAE